MTDSAQPQPMIYEVTATVRADLVAGWEEYLRHRHVAEVVATGPRELPFGLNVVRRCDSPHPLMIPGS